MDFSGIARALVSPNKKPRGRSYLPSIGEMRLMGARALGQSPTAARQQPPPPDAAPAQEAVAPAPDNQPQPEAASSSTTKATMNPLTTNPLNEQNSDGEIEDQRSRTCSEDRAANVGNDNPETDANWPTDAANGHIVDDIDLSHIKQEPEDDHPIQANSTPAEATDQQSELRASVGHEADPDDHPIQESSTPAEDTEQQWELRAIVSHEVDPDDPTRLRFRCRWANTDPKNSLTWEPECNIQEDAHAMWKSYVKKANPRQDLGQYKDYWHILGIKGHTKAKGGKFNMKVSWVGFEKDDTVSEDFVEENNAELLQEYWQSVGGRESAVQARPTRKRKRTRA